MPTHFNLRVEFANGVLVNGWANPNEAEFAARTMWEKRIVKDWNPERRWEKALALQSEYQTWS